LHSAWYACNKAFQALGAARLARSLSSCQGLECVKFSARVLLVVRQFLKALYFGF
jgi:hypothetical protein